MFDLGQLRKLAKAPHSGVEEVKTARVHLALEPGYLNNLDAGIKHNFNAKINQHFADLHGVLLGYSEIKKQPHGALLADSPFVHIDVTAKFFVFKPVVGACLSVSVIKKSSGHLGALLNDIFNVSVICSSSAKDRIQLGDNILVTVDRVSSVGERPVLLASLAQDLVSQGASTSSAASRSMEEDADSGVDSERGRREGGEKRKAEDVVVDEAERKRIKKAAKKARKEKERLDASRIAQGEDPTDDVVSVKKTIEFKGDMTEISTTPKRKGGGQELGLSDLPEGFQIILKETEKKKWKEFLGPDGKKYRSRKDIQDRFVEGVSPSPARARTGSPKKSVKKEVVKNVVESIEEVVQSWNVSEDGELSEDHPKYLVYSDRQLEEMEATSKHFWVQPEKKARTPKAKPSKPLTVKMDFSKKTKQREEEEEEEEDEEDIEEEIESSPPEPAQEAMAAMVEELNNTSEKKKKKKKKHKKHSEQDNE